MAKKAIHQSQVNADQTTEEKILNAARKLFTNQGFNATRTRDIAEEAGINLALLNYYFRSKEKLFAIVMKESVGTFLETILGIIGNKETSLEEKTSAIITFYIDTLCRQPDIPLFVMNEVRKNPKQLFGKVAKQDLFRKSPFFNQIMEQAKSKGIKKPNPIHYFMNMMGLTIFPFIAAPMIKMIGGLPDAEFVELMQERKRMIPVWVKAISAC